MVICSPQTDSRSRPPISRSFLCYAKGGGIPAPRHHTLSRRDLPRRPRSRAACRCMRARVELPTFLYASPARPMPAARTSKLAGAAGIDGRAQAEKSAAAPWRQRRQAAPQEHTRSSKPTTDGFLATGHRSPGRTQGTVLGALAGLSPHHTSEHESAGREGAHRLVATKRSECRANHCL